MELKISKEDFDNLSHVKKLKIISLCFDLLAISDNSIILSNVEIKSSKEFVSWLEGNWGVLQATDRINLP